MIGGGGSMKAGDIDKQFADKFIIENGAILLKYPKGIFNLD